MNEELLAAFLVEGRELTAQAGQDLAVLARHPADRTLLDQCFRAIHTLKGSAGLFDLPPMSRVLHVAEDVMGAARSGDLSGQGVFELLLEVVDQVDRWLDDLERSGALAMGGDTVERAFMARLNALLGGRTSSEPTAMAAPAEGGVAIRYTPDANCYFQGDDPIAIIAAVPGLASLSISHRAPVGDLASYDPFVCNLVLEAVSTADRATVEAALRLVADQVVLSEQVVETVQADSGEGGVRTIRVEAERIDRLADVTGELVIAKGGIGGLAEQADRLEGGRALAHALRAQQAKIDRLVADLHGTVSEVRLTPLNPLFGRFPRLVREVARSLDKVVILDVEGGEIQVDKAVVDGLHQPLLHVLRNALDHGVEAPSVRQAAGKLAAGHVRLSARTVGEQVVIEIADDGAGMDPARIRQLAVVRGLISASDAALLDEREALNLIFLPGFSTAATVTDLSGRGVGMDAVRSSIAHLGGRVEVSSVVGLGSTARFVLPISMVLTKVMVVTCGGERYGLALEDVVETTKVRSDRVVKVRAGEAFVLRDQVIPLVRLGDLVGASASSAAEASRVIVARVGDELVGFAVDAIVDRLDAAVRPMTGMLAGARGVTGSTLLADGAVLMMLDLQELIR